jgi:hypothetical protein
MSSQGAESIARRYVGTAGRTADDRYQLDIDQLIWLVEHCSRVGELRLGLLRDLQSALPSSQEPGMVAEFKELLTNLIIMETRVSDRSGRLSELLNQLTGSGLLDRVSVDQVALTEAIQSIIEANGHVRAVVGDQI